jgi:hypothetical protein
MINYALMKKLHPQQKSALTRALKTKDPAKVRAVCAKAVREWETIGAWPDDWSRWQRALSDMMVREQLEDLLKDEKSY